MKSVALAASLALAGALCACGSGARPAPVTTTVTVAPPTVTKTVTRTVTHTVTKSIPAPLPASCRSAEGEINRLYHLLGSAEATATGIDDLLSTLRIAVVTSDTKGAATAEGMVLDKKDLFGNNLADANDAMKRLVADLRECK